MVRVLYMYGMSYKYWVDQKVCSVFVVRWPIKNITFGMVLVSSHALKELSKLECFYSLILT